MRPIPAGFMAGTGAWTPASLPGLRAWWRSDSNVLTDGDGVYEWGDITSNGWDLTQSTGAKKPQLISSHAGFNDHPAIDFATDDFLQTSTWTLITQPHTTWVVAESDVWPTGGSLVFIDGVDGNDRVLTYERNATGDPWSMWAGSANLDGASPGASDVVYYAVSKWDGSSSYFRMNGTEYTGNPGADGVAGITAGASNADAGHLDGQIAEIGVVDSALSAGDLASLETYLSTRYGL